MIDHLKRQAARIGICAIILAVWLSGLGGWLWTAAAAPFAVGLGFHVWRDL